MFFYHMLETTNVMNYRQFRGVYDLNCEVREPELSVCAAVRVAAPTLCCLNFTFNVFLSSGKKEIMLPLVKICQY
jgi:hypothetical protein